MYVYYALYPNDTPENRRYFLSDWVDTQFCMQDEICYQISAETLAKNFSRLHFQIDKDGIVSAFIEKEYTAIEQNGKRYEAVGTSALPICD